MLKKKKVEEIQVAEDTSSSSSTSTSSSHAKSMALAAKAKAMAMEKEMGLLRTRLIELENKEKENSMKKESKPIWMEEKSKAAVPSPRVFQQQHQGGGALCPYSPLAPTNSLACAPPNLAGAWGAVGT
jgi:hypothetical protein